LFQALVDAAASRWRNATFIGCAKPALVWLQLLQPPTVVAPTHHVGVPFRIAVPNNDLDVWAGPISQGNIPKKQPNELKTMKTVCASRLHIETPDRDAIHYLFPLADGDCLHFNVLQSAARSITHLGWGIDMVAGNASILTDDEAAKLPGERWQPVNGSANALRVPKNGTLDNLISKHESFLNRIGPDGFKPVPPLSAFDVVGYARDTDPKPRLFEAFSILKPDAEGFRSYDPVRRTAVVAGMVRHAAASAAMGWTSEKVCTLIHGHTPDGKQKGRSEDCKPRFAYVPLPTIATKGGGHFNVAGAIRRVLVLGSGVSSADIAWARRALSGQELIDQDSKQPQALLSLLPKSDHHVRLYTNAAAVWDTVCPVVLPGHDDGDPVKAEKLLRQAIRQAGFSETLAKHAYLEWRKVGFRPGVDLAQRYQPPHYLLKYPRFHVRIAWRDSSSAPLKIGGPIVIGGGRFCGFGLFAPTDE